MKHYAGLKGFLQTEIWKYGEQVTKARGAPSVQFYGPGNQMIETVPIDKKTTVDQIKSILAKHGLTPA